MSVPTNANDEALVQLKCYSAMALLSSNNDATKVLQDITSRIQNHENAILYSKKAGDKKKQEKNDLPSSTVHEQVQRAYNAVVLEHSIYSSVFKWVPENYYSFTLAERAKVLNAQSTWQLCKSMLMENKAFDESLPSVGGTYSRFYLIVLQYETTISTKKLVSEVRALKKPVTERYDTNKFDFRLASSEDNDRLTGYLHNSVSPFGLLEKKSVSIILSKSIVDMTTGAGKATPFIWMGGGHVHCKVGMAIADFITALSPLVLDVTDPRIGGDETNL